MLLEKLIVSCNAKPIPIRTFSAQELQQATDNYANYQFWDWYKGSLEARKVRMGIGLALQETISFSNSMLPFLRNALSLSFLSNN
ncbi:non-functional pseudokinase ZED1-like [Fagus crenata]